MLVRRERAYLREVAEVFAHTYGLQQSVRQLYSDQSGGVLSVKQEDKRRSVRQKRGSFLRLPVDRGSFWVSSLFGPRRQSNGARGFHYGVDLAASRGTPVKASASGQVIFAGYAPGFGNMILLRHSDSCKTRYAHLDSIRVKKDQWVTEGELIGLVGSTGHIRKSGKDGSHLHFELELNNKRVNPLAYVQ